MKTLTFSQKNKVKVLTMFTLLLTLTLSTNSIYAQTERTVKGVIYDDIGPIDGATILLKDTNTYAVTDEKGAFTFPQKLKENDQLVISSLGFKDKLITITADTSPLTISMTDYDIVIVGSLRVGSNETPKNNKR